ncbi:MULTISPECIES: hypothetical protein [unclassified Streptomyces]|uniref:hypothetical protein n=1 Tax=unclassified Streptomyces TaxID=2593676 RepID=UPI00131B9963|nr:hypothetical protein [Streptomyces sp. CB01635]
MRNTITDDLVAGQRDSGTAGAGRDLSAAGRTALRRRLRHLSPVLAGERLGPARKAELLRRAG